MEKFSQFRDRGKSFFFLSLSKVENNLTNEINRFRHCALFPGPSAALGLHATVARLLVLLPAAATYICVLELFPRLAVSSHRFAGQKSIAMVYSRRAESMVD
jgi:hypothetical protein